ncbi:Protein kinase [Phytophthora cinnamomi]|uniref:Protein kinase n=1 Tax=Phytophthora cinnamomi TaxID=4785 RepID=UPI002A317340|nr:Protein kinase [Phytophthora cinnamomi]KAJ8544584.1 hypothetical protein ON010_g11683 [Phytophthora cinnamomi]
MERKDRKRKAVEIADSSAFALPEVTGLISRINDHDAELKKQIRDVRDDINIVQKQLTEKCEECRLLQEEAAMLHPDAVLERMQTKLWHHGDLRLFRNVIDPRNRVDIEGHSLHLSECAPKMAGSKAPISSSRTYGEFSPKHESDEGPVPARESQLTEMEINANRNDVDESAEAKETDPTSGRLPVEQEVQGMAVPEREANAAESEDTICVQQFASLEKALADSEHELAETELMDCGA